MIAEARRRAEELAPAVRARIEFRVADVLALGDDGEGPLDAVTALGLVEYLADDRNSSRGRRAGCVRAACSSSPAATACSTWRASTSTPARVRRRRRSGAPGRPRALPIGCDAPALLDDFVRRLKDALPELETALAQDRAAGAEAPDRSAEFRASGASTPRARSRPWPARRDSS